MGDKDRDLPDSLNFLDEDTVIDATDPAFGKKLEFAFMATEGSSAYRNDRQRPYNGQPHTDDGIRGRTMVHGLTMRDIRDCFVKGLLLSCGGIDNEEQNTLYESVKEGTWRTDDVYKVELSQIDPLAVAQNMTCEVERMMGIFPNVPPLDKLPKEAEDV